MVLNAKQKGYEVILLFFWLNTVDLALSRVRNRVKEGGHNIPPDVVKRRYEKGLDNFFKLYLPVVDNWMFINNSGEEYEVIAEGTKEFISIHKVLLWDYIKRDYE